MKHSLRTAESISFVTASILGTIFHFIYKWSGDNPVAGIFFPVNESTWEHLKLIFFPIMILSIIEYFVLDGQYKNFICIKFLSALLAMIMTIILFYTYTGVYGKNSDVMNILIYFLSMAAAYWFSYRSLKRNRLCHVSSLVCYWGFIIMTLLFIVFTLFPPNIGLFISPV